MNFRTMEFIYEFQDGNEAFLSSGFDILFVRIEGSLSIILDNAVFFSEPYMSLLELGLQMQDWLNHITSGGKINFRYHCLDWDESEGFLLTFDKAGEELWKIDSIWKKTVATPETDEKNLVHGIDEFLQKLKTELMIKYSIDFGECFRYYKRHSLHL